MTTKMKTKTAKKATQKPAQRRTKTTLAHKRLEEYAFEDRFAVDCKSGTYRFTLPKRLLSLIGSNELRDAIKYEAPLYVRMRSRLADQGETWTLNISTTDAGE